jgi:heme A synthase
MTSSSTSSTLERWFAPLAGLTSLAILCQAITAGQFVSQEDRDGWIEAHNIIGLLTVVLAVATAVVAVILFRRRSRAIVWAAIALAVLTILQLVIGHLITDLEQDGWIGLHVPLAFVIFGLTGWLSFRSAALRRHPID